MAADAHGILLFTGLDVALHLLGVDGGGPASDSQGNEHVERLFHFASTIFVEENPGAQALKMIIASTCQAHLSTIPHLFS